MVEFAQGLGMTLMVFGGILIAAVILLLLGLFVGIAWIAFSDNFRAICKAESLIFEYRKNREKFLEWKVKEDGK